LFFGAAWEATASALSLCLAFGIVAPASWRVLFPPRPLPLWSMPLRLLAYAAVGLLVVRGVGVWMPQLLAAPKSTFLVGSVSVWITVALWWVGGWGLGRDVELSLSLQREQRRAEGLQREAESARLLALKNHLDPHFLFNTLNAIAEWCRTDGEVAERAVLQLSAILRIMLDGVQKPTWALSRELDLVETLCALHLLRDEALFQLSLQRGAGSVDVPVPPLLLLPLIENAIKHGPAAGHRGRIDVSATVEAQGLVVEVTNPGPYRGPRDGGHGLDIVKSRARLWSGGTVELIELPAQEGGAPRTRARLVLPLATPEPP
jgi:two-component system sensor histidine kinase AlgZ